MAFQKNWQVAGLVALQMFGVSMSGAEEERHQALEEVEVTAAKVSTSAYRVEAMGTASKFGLSSMETPQSVTAVTRAQIEDFALLNVNAVLDNVVGLNVEEVETDRVYFTSRGFDVTNFQVDGLGLPLTSGNSHGDIDTAIYERVEVVRGANGLMAGAGNPSATINLVRKRPDDQFQGRVSGMAGSWDNQRGEVDVSGTLTEGVRARAVAVKQSRESYLDWYELDKSVFYSIVDFALGEDTVLAISYAQQTSDADSPMWGALTLYNTDGSLNEYDVATSSSNDWAFWDSEVTTAHIDLVHHFSDDWQLTLAYSEIQTDEHSELFYVYSTDLISTPPGEVLLTGYGSEYSLDEKQQLADIYIKGLVPLFGRDHELVFGASWSERRTEQLSLYDYSTGNGFPVIGSLYDWQGSTPRPTFVDGARGGDVTDEQSAIYATVRANISDSLKIIVGARLSDYEATGENYGVDQSTSHNSVLTPYLGAVYNFTPELMAYGSYTEIFLPQNELGADGKRLDPVFGEASELGIKASLFESRLIASFALFEIEQTNLAQSVGFDPDRGEEIYRGSDGINSTGYELELAGELAAGWSLSLGYTDLDIDASGIDENVENYTPERTFKLATSYAIPALPALKVGANINWRSEISRNHPDTVDTSTDPANPTVIATNITTTQDSYAIVNLMAAYDLTKNFNITVNVNNVTDEKYLTSLYWDQSYYGAPRNYQVTANYRF